MPFLTVNGVTCPVLLNTLEHGEPELVGSRERSADGTLVESVIATKRLASFKTTPLVQADANTWEKFVTGAGERWDFASSYYGSRGSKPASTSGLGLGSSPAPKHGTYFLTISSTYYFTINGIYTSGGTLCTLLWKYESGAWHHYAIDGNAVTVYRDGAVYGSSISSWFSATSGNVAFGPGSIDIDDVVILPYYVNPTWYPAIYTWHNANPWPALPQVKLGGDAIPETTRTVKGVLTGRNAIKGTVGGTRYTNLGQLAFDVLEV